MSSNGVDNLRRKRPEWSPWLDVVNEVVRETTNGSWDAAQPDEIRIEPSVPLLSGARISVDGAAVRRLVGRLIDAASRDGTPKMRTLRSLSMADGDLGAVFSASVCQEYDAIAPIAARSGSDPDALQAIVALIAFPFLQASNRRWAAAIPKDWIEGFCPVCGSWPAFAEMRGIERNRHLRCGRCGAEWHSYLLHCGYCGTSDHDELASLLPGNGGSPGAIDACRRCRGYVKVFTRLQGCAPADVVLEDLGSVDLDVAALEQGYIRPPGTGRGLNVVVTATSSARRLFAWNG